MLPEWFDLDALRLTVTSSVVVFALGALAALVVVRKVVARILLLLVLGGLAAAGVAYTSALDECEARCDCKVFFDRIEIDDCVEGSNPG